LSTMKAPVACWPGTVARTQGSVTVTSACARVGRLNKAARENRELAIVRFILIILLGFTCSKPAPGGYQPRLRQPFAYGAGQFAACLGCHTHRSRHCGPWCSWSRSEPFGKRL